MLMAQRECVQYSFAGRLCERSFNQSKPTFKCITNCQCNRRRIGSFPELRRTFETSHPTLRKAVFTHWLGYGMLSIYLLHLSRLFSKHRKLKFANTQIPRFIANQQAQEHLVTTMPVWVTRRWQVCVQLHLLQGMRGEVAGHRRRPHSSHQLHYATKFRGRQMYGNERMLRVQLL